MKKKKKRQSPELGLPIASLERAGLEACSGTPLPRHRIDTEIVINLTRKIYQGSCTSHKRNPILLGL